MNECWFVTLGRLLPNQVVCLRTNRTRTRTTRACVSSARARSRTRTPRHPDRARRRTHNAPDARTHVPATPTDDERTERNDREKLTHTQTDRQKTRDRSDPIGDRSVRARTIDAFHPSRATNHRWKRSIESPVIDRSNRWRATC